MRRILLTLSLLSVLLAPAGLAIGQASAVEAIPNCGRGSVNGTPDVCNEVNNQKGNNGSNNPIISIIKTAIHILSYIVGAAAIIGIIVSGLRMILSNGDANSVANARNGLIYSLVGVAVVVLAQTIVFFVIDKVH